MAKNILICDDAAFMRMMIKDILTKNGYNVIGEAENGLKAVEKYNELKPDLVLMDITMPEMDGIQALKNIKASLVVNKIMLSEGLGVTQQMLDAQYQSIADQYKMTLEDVKKALEPNKNEFLRQLSNKVFTEFMLAHN